MKNCFALALVTIACAATAKAQLHDSFDQCKARYGDPIGVVAATAPADKVAVFKTETHTIVISFMKERAVELTFMRIDKGDLSPAAIAEFLKSSAEGSVFVKGSSSEDTKLAEWTRKDQKADAVLGVTGKTPFLLISDSEYDKGSE